MVQPWKGFLIIAFFHLVVAKPCTTPRKEDGICVRVQECSYLLEILKESKFGNSSSSIALLRGSICGFQGRTPLVCCKKEVGPVHEPPSRLSVSSSSNISQTDLLPKACGTNGLADRIVDGEDAPLGRWPWMVLFGTKNAAGKMVWFCGGALISDRYVLTAAHCFTSIRNPIVRLGEHTVSRNPDCSTVIGCAPPVQDLGTEEILSHPSYDLPCNECNDIALVRLNDTANINEKFVFPVCLPLQPETDMGYGVDEFHNKVAFATGWGSVSRDPMRPKAANVLQQVQLPLRSLSYCEHRKNFYPNPGMVLCAGGEGKDTCKGDSGGPLTLASKFGWKDFIVGVTSVGPVFCGSQDTQGIYTNVHYYIPWILQSLRP